MNKTPAPLNKLYLAAGLAMLLIAGCSFYPQKILSYFMGDTGAASMPYELSLYRVKKADYNIELKRPNAQANELQHLLHIYGHRLTGVPP